MNKVIIILLSTLSFICCKNTQHKNIAFLTDSLKVVYSPLYANGFEMYRYSNSTILKIIKPWQGDTETSIYYFFARGGDTPPEGFKGVVIDLPVSRVISMSTSYNAFMERLRVDSLIKAVSGSQFVYSPAMQKRIEASQIRDVGYEGGLNYELLVDIKPDVMFIYGVSGENSIITDRVLELGVKVVYLGDYLERSPLGRAEWIVVFGEIFGKRELAQAVFDNVARRYNEIKAEAKFSGKKPKVMLNTPWRDTWFVPGDRSYMVQLINDASGDYVCKGEDSDSSRPISSESAYMYTRQADVWLNPGGINTLSELVTINPNFKDVPSVVNGKVFNNNARNTPRGGSDFWESGAVAPHIVLSDVIKILHPELLPDHELYYFHQLN